MQARVKEHVVRISHMAPGESGVILEVGLDPGTDKRMNEEGVRRLQELGFVPGERITVVRRGFPSGDPLAVRVGTSLFALRRVEASAIKVARG